MLDFSNVTLNLMTTILSSKQFRSLYRDDDLKREALTLAPFCETAYDIYGVVLLHYLFHVNKLGFPRDYIMVKESGMIPKGTLDIPTSVESGILFTGGIAWERQELTRNTPICSLIKSTCYHYGLRSINKVREQANALLNNHGKVRIRSWHLVSPVELTFGAAEALTVADKLSAELNVVMGGLSDVRTLSEYEINSVHLNFRAGMSNYTQGFKDLLDLIVRIRRLREKEKNFPTADYFAFFRKKNEDVFVSRWNKDTPLTAEELTTKLKALALLEDETCYHITGLLRTMFLEPWALPGADNSKGRELNVQRVFAPSSDTLAGTFGFAMSVSPDANKVMRGVGTSRQIFVTSFPVDVLGYNHVGDAGREETFKAYLDVANIDEHLVLDMPTIILCVGTQFITLSDEVTPPNKQYLPSGNGYVSANLYMRDSAYYFMSELKRIVETVNGF